MKATEIRIGQTNHGSRRGTTRAQRGADGFAGDPWMRSDATKEAAEEVAGKRVVFMRLTVRPDQARALVVAGRAWGIPPSTVAWALVEMGLAGMRRVDADMGDMPFSEAALRWLGHQRIRYSLRPSSGGIRTKQGPAGGKDPFSLAAHGLRDAGEADGSELPASMESEVRALELGALCCPGCGVSLEVGVRALGLTSDDQG